MQHLPASIKTIWLQSAGFSLLGWLLLLGSYLLGRHFWQWLPKWGLVIILILAVGELTIEVALIPYRYAFYSYRVNETDVEIKHGFFFRKWISIPIARVQNVDLNQGPLLQFKNLYSVTIATGGSSHEIEALSKSDAQKLKNRVMILALEARNAN